MMNGESMFEQWINTDLNPTCRDEQFLIDWWREQIDCFFSKRFFLFIFRVFFVSTLNFSFWLDDNENESYCQMYKGKIYYGYEALCASINKALDVKRNFSFDVFFFQ